MTSREMDMATCYKSGKELKKELKLDVFVLHKHKKERFYQSETIAWTIHWKTTKTIVHRKKYAIRNQGKR